MTALVQHRLPSKLLTKRVEILLVGAGGTGSRILEKLVCLHRALIPSEPQPFAPRLKTS